MTSMNVCVLQEDDTLFCGDVGDRTVPKIVGNLDINMKTVIDIIDGIEKARYPWNLTSYSLGRREKIDPVDVFNFYETGGVPMKYMTTNDLYEEAPEGNVFIDLKNKKIIHLALRTPMGSDFPTSKVHVYKDNPNAEKKVDECYASGIPYHECVNKYKRSEKTIPKGFVPIPVVLEKLNAEGYVEEDPRAMTDLLATLRSCDHPSGEFYRSMGGCL